MRSFSLFVALVVAVVLLAEASLASRVIIRNNCGGDVQAVWTGNGQGSRVVCNLGRGQGCQVSEGGGGNFKSGWGGKTLAEFDFNNGGKDWYDLSVIVGYDVPMSIQAPFGGYSPSCYNGGCPGAMHYPDDTSKIHAVGTGGTFVLTFC